MINLNEMKAKDLKEMAKGLQVSNWWNLKKDKLVEKISIAIGDKTDKNPDYDIEKEFPQFATQNASESIEVENNITNQDSTENEPERDEVKTKQEELSLEIVAPPKPKRGALIEYDGKAQNICKWGEELGMSPNTLYGRIYKMGWSVERAFTTPTRKSK